jgi:hypothetical protein
MKQLAGADQDVIKSGATLTKPPLERKSFPCVRVSQKGDALSDAIDSIVVGR